MPDLPTGTVTLLFTDIEGSTRLLQQLGEHYAAVLADCRHLLRSLFQQYHGHEVDTQGDAFFVAFARATDAISAAIDIQRALADQAWPDGASVRVRIGLHTGEPMLTADGYIGIDVHHAARIMSAGNGGQILPACQFPAPQDTRYSSQQPAHPANSFYRAREGSCGSHAVAQAIRCATGDAYRTGRCG